MTLLSYRNNDEQMNFRVEFMRDKPDGEAGAWTSSIKSSLDKPLTVDSRDFLDLHNALHLCFSLNRMDIALDYE